MGRSKKYQPGDETVDAVLRRRDEQLGRDGREIALGHFCKGESSARRPVSVVRRETEKLGERTETRTGSSFGMSGNKRPTIMNGGEMQGKESHLKIEQGEKRERKCMNNRDNAKNSTLHTKKKKPMKPAGRWTIRS